MDKRVIEKIQKLLALATSPVEAEAKAAAEKANELLIRHNLSMQDVAAAEKVYDGPVAVEKSKLSTEDGYVFTILEDHFFVTVIRDYTLRRHGGDTRVHFVGEQTNIQVAIYIYGFLHGAYRRLWHAFQEKNNLPRIAKKSYYNGLTAGISDQLTVKRRSVENEMGLVLAPDANIAKYIENSIGPLKNGPTTKYYSFPTIEDAGFEAGKNLRIRRGIESKGTEKDLYLTQN